MNVIRMNMIRNKLKDKSGMSILMGLLFLLVSLMVGTVVLVASTAAAGKLAGQKQSEQDYLTVASAARLVKDRICKSTYSYTKVTIEGSAPSAPTELLTVSDGKAIILEDELKKPCRILVEYASDPTLQGQLDNAKNSFGSFTISCNPSAGMPSDVTLDTVYGSLGMKTDGRIIVTLWLGSSSESDSKNHNHMTIEFCPDGPVEKTKVESVESGGVITNTVTVTTTCSWPESGCTITKGKGGA